MFIKYLSSSCIRSDHFLFFLRNLHSLLSMSISSSYHLQHAACSDFFDFHPWLIIKLPYYMKSAKYHKLAVIIGQASSWYFTWFIPLASSSFLSFNRECEIYILHSKLSVWPLSHLQFQLSKCPSKCLSSSLHSINIKIKHSSGLFAGEFDIDIYLLIYFILLITTTNLHFPCHESPCIV